MRFMSKILNFYAAFLQKYAYLVALYANYVIITNK